MGATTDWILLLAALAALAAAANEKMKEQVVVDLPSDSSGLCIRLLNATHQFGCGSSMDGEEGVLVVPRTKADLKGASNGWAERFPDYSGGFMVLMDELLLDGSTAPLLRSSDRVAGVLLMPRSEKEEVSRNISLSTEAACPNKHASLYSDWRACGSSPAKQWNGKGAMLEQGMRFTDWPKPMIRLLNETVLETMIKCHDTYNLPGGKAQGRLCAVGSVKSFMLAAGSSTECMRRGEMSLTKAMSEMRGINFSLCDHLDDFNLHALFPPGVQGKASPSEYLAVLTRIDGISMIPDASPSTYGTMTSLVTALAAAKVIGDNLETFEKASEKSGKGIIFAYLNGESFDYLGSSRWVYDMDHGEFSKRKSDANGEVFTIDKISLAVELQQIDGSGVLHAHVDGKNYDADEKAKGKIKKALEKMRNATKGDGFELKEERVTTKGVLPPSSLHSILKRRRQTPSVLLTSFDEQYSNLHLHSVFDRLTGGEEKQKKEEKRVKKSLAAVAKGVVALMADHVGIDEETQKKLNIDTKWLDMLSACFIATTSIPDCPYLNVLFEKEEVVDRSTYIFSEKYSLLRKAIHQLLILATGERKSTNNAQSEKLCGDLDKKQSVYSYKWQLDPWANVSSCYRTSITQSRVRSPAFISDDDGVKLIAGSNYSTWVEARYRTDDSFSLVLVERQPADWTVMGVGLLTVLLSILIVGRCDDSSFIVDEGERAAEEGEPL